MEKLRPILGSCQEEEISYLWLVSSQNKVSCYYIVLEASLGPSDLTPLIQGLLETSRTFTVTYHKSLKLFLGLIDLIWQEFESIKSPTLENLKLLYPSKVRI
jgi:hypothetical protein